MADCQGILLLQLAAGADVQLDRYLVWIGDRGRHSLIVLVADKGIDVIGILFTVVLCYRKWLLRGYSENQQRTETHQGDIFSYCRYQTHVHLSYVSDLFCSAPQCIHKYLGPHHQPNIEATPVLINNHFPDHWLLTIIRLASLVLVSNQYSGPTNVY